MTKHKVSYYKVSLKGVTAKFEKGVSRWIEEGHACAVWKESETWTIASCSLTNKQSMVRSVLDFRLINHRIKCHTSNVSNVYVGGLFVHRQMTELGYQESTWTTRVEYAVARFGFELNTTCKNHGNSPGDSQQNSTTFWAYDS